MQWTWMAMMLTLFDCVTVYQCNNTLRKWCSKSETNTDFLIKIDFSRFVVRLFLHGSHCTWLCAYTMSIILRHIVAAIMLWASILSTRVASRKANFFLAWLGQIRVEYWHRETLADTIKIVSCPFKQSGAIF